MYLVGWKPEVDVGFLFIREAFFYIISPGIRLFLVEVEDVISHLVVDLLYKTKIDIY